MFSKFIMIGSGRRRTSQLLCLMVGILLLGTDCATYNDSDNDNDDDGDGGRHYGKANANFFRFRDFVPRTADELVDVQNSTAARRARGFQFHADNRDLIIDMEFIVPFVRIPVHRSMELTSSALRSLVNLNTGTLLWTGLFVAVGAVLAFFVKAFSTPLVYNYGNGRSTRADDTDVDFANVMDPFNLVAYGHAMDGMAPLKNVMKVNDFVSVVESKLQQNNIDMTACVQKVICGYVKKASADVRQGNGSSWYKILDGLASLESLQYYLSGTAMQNAIEMGRSTKTCDYVYKNCKWLQPENKFISFVLNYITNYTNG